jgi:flagellar protein FlaJ
MNPVVERASSLWFRTMEPLVKRTQRTSGTAKALRAARMRTFVEYYVALSYLGGFLAAVVMGGAGFLAARASPTLSPVWYASWAIGGASAVLGFAFTRLAFLAYPSLRATGRARRIDAEMPEVVTMCYALARGDVAPLEIVRTIASERQTYGEAAVEFGVVIRNVEWLGLDLVSAIQDAAETTPSAKLRAFLDGFVTMINSGADAKDYFRHQAKQETASAQLGLERDLEQASLLAEIYVSGLLVLPLLLMVVISGLAPLAAEQTALMPVIVFAMIPLGTVIYLVLVDVLLPPESLAIRKADAQALGDFGLASVDARAPLLPPPWKTQWPEHERANLSKAEIREAKALRRKIMAERARQRVRAGWRSFHARMLARPTDALQFSALLGLAILVGGGLIAWRAGLSTADLEIVGTGILVAALMATAIPVSVYHEIRVHRSNKVAASLPENLSKLAGFNERGIGLLQSFTILGRSATGPLAKEFRAVEQDVGWNGSLLNALRRLRERVNTLRMTKLGILLERASAATGNLREVLDIAATDATTREHLRSTRKQSMMSYVVIVYVVFAVFLYVLYVVANMFYGAGGLSAAAGAINAGGVSKGLEARNAQILFAQAAVVQGVACGLVAGRLGEGYTLSGLKHAALLGALAYVVFLVGVLS